MIKFLKDPKVAHSFHGTCDVDASEVDGLEAWLSLGNMYMVHLIAYSMSHVCKCKERYSPAHHVPSSYSSDVNGILLLLGRASRFTVEGRNTYEQAV